MDLQRRSRLKIRRAPSCKMSQTSSSFHGCCRQIKKKGYNNIVRQPLIMHTFDPEIIVAEPSEFMSVVQRLTGSLHTRRLLCTSMRKLKEMQRTLQVGDGQLVQQGKDPLKEGTTNILAPITSLSNPDLSINDLSESLSNPNDLISEEIKHAPELPLSSHANISLLSNPMSIILPAKESDKLITTSDELISPNSSSEGDNYLSTEGGASPYREAFISICLTEEGNTLMNEGEKDGISTHFFVFSGDSYYGSSYEAAQEYEVEYQYSNVLDSFSQFSMPLGTYSEALSFI